VDTNKRGVVGVLPCDLQAFDTNQSLVDPNTLSAAFIAQGKNGQNVSFSAQDEDGLYNSGFFVHPGDWFLLQFDIVNYHSEAQKVYLALDFEYEEGRHGVDTTTAIISATGCKSSAPNMSEVGPAITQRQKFPVLVDASVAQAVAHIHERGDLVKISVNDQEFCHAGDTTACESRTR
jgi:hypothetical protein